MFNLSDYMNRNNDIPIYVPINERDKPVCKYKRRTLVYDPNITNEELERYIQAEKENRFYNRLTWLTLIGIFVAMLLLIEYLATP